MNVRGSPDDPIAAADTPQMGNLSNPFQMIVDLETVARARIPRGIRLGSYFVQTWGCQMNEEDSEQIALHMDAAGYLASSTAQQAQIVLLNTCSVRSKPEDKALSFLGEMRLYKQAHPEVVIGVAGCMAQSRPEDIRRRNPHVDFIVGTAHISEIPGLVQQALELRRFQKRLELPERKGAIVTDIPRRKVASVPKIKAFVPIQYGCDKFCSFCIVPTTRGRERSRPTIDIVEEVSSLAELGTKEVTLLGQTVNSYGKNLAEGRVPFADLLLLLARIPQLKRIRYTSPYPRDFRDDLIEVIATEPKVMEQVHLPVQAGSDSLLGRMKRVYTVDSFLAIVDNLRARVPGVSLTTDVIVGFPGETDQEFQETLDLVENVKFTGAFMFRYSPRKGTPASDMVQVPEETSRRRLQKLILLQNGITSRFHKSLEGKHLEVLVEGVSPKNTKMLQGFSREGVMVHFEGDAKLAGEIVDVRATKGFLWGVVAKVSS